MRRRTTVTRMRIVVIPMDHLPALVEVDSVEMALLVKVYTLND